MKEFLKELYIESRRDFELWNYLWLFSDSKNEIEFSHSELCGRFSMSLTTLKRVIKRNIENWNGDKCFVTYEKLGFSRFRVVFFPKGKKADKLKESSLDSDLFEWLKSYYESIEFDYSDLVKHKRYIKTICSKLEKAMKERGAEVTDQSLNDTFVFFFKSIPNWWVENSNITLPLISKHFTKILNQIKTSSNGKKRDSYSKAAESADGIDFGKLARN